MPWTTPNKTAANSPPGWPNPSSIDLVARARATPLDCEESGVPEMAMARYNLGIVTDVEYGIMFFRY